MAQAPDRTRARRPSHPATNRAATLAGRGLAIAGLDLVERRSWRKADPQEKGRL